MDATSNGDIQSCIITTGVSSLNYYNEYMQSYEENNTIVYNCMRVSSIKNIAKVENYKVVIDFCDNNIKEIVFELFNYLLPFNVELNVKVIYNVAISSDDIEQCMILLNRLDKHKLITLEIINKSSELPKEKEETSWIKKLKNMFFFTGAGNTGKTSLITALSELCNEKGHTVALVDITENNKLINYFTDIYPLIGANPQENFNKERVNDNKKAFANLYTYNYKSLLNATEERVFCESLKKISSTYDYVLVNTDINTVYGNSEIFNLAEKVFIVHDFMLTKINSAREILLMFDEAGINTEGNIALIYNKIIKCQFNIGFIEERMIFKKLDSKRLVPLVDLNCETFEIPYSKKTMRAMINNISHNKSIINNVAYSYRRNIDYIYKYINNVPHVEISDIDVIDYAKNSLHNILQYSHIKNLKEDVYKYIEHVNN
ncbi:P-loop NTPase family protein [Alkaliphilus peptidifermentans]|uniref:CO dehydrogenase nickel-insertion accessory protein CooC1 n=1 Tax=Alkaliphilus peptidifermentans DSM 18978 TaxID=1120976 RepID=A0A1G5EVR5_9FIRM|nr:hypothetical protein [Alkaliphilus peptidifermentans]SCY31095.1 CO dehydrogenase nickel-insertion accessory protein CooC1 [Alkaliphilus peptidifermentans DSM 18978]